MAYAFNQLDNYMRRDKEGKQGGGMQKAGLVEAAPTKAATELAKTAETSQEQGNSAARFQAMQKAPTQALTSRLAEPGKKQAQDWTTQTEQAGNQYLASGREQIKQAAPEFKAADVTAAEGGNAEATARLRQGLAPTTQTFQPFQVATPTLDTSSMLRSGVGGIQAALQQKGGRYTPGMAAMDASALAASPQAISALQSQFGGLQQGMRGVQEKVGGYGKTLEKEATDRGAKIKADVQKALEGRVAEFKRLGAEAATKGAQGMEAESQGQARKTAAGFSPYDVQDLIQSAGQQQYVANVDPAYANIAAILGINPEQFTQSYNVYSPNIEAINARNASIRAGQAEAAQREQQQQQTAAATQGPGFLQISGGSPGVSIPPIGAPMPTMKTDIFGNPLSNPMPAPTGRSATEIDYTPSHSSPTPPPSPAPLAPGFLQISGGSPGVSIPPIGGQKETVKYDMFGNPIKKKK